MSKSLKDLISEVERIAQEEGWSVSVEEHNEYTTFEFRKGSPAGHDFGFCADYEGSVESLIDNIYRSYDDFDISSEAYLWLDSEGHGTNGAPWDMRDVYDDFESSMNNILALHDALSEADWRDYE